jgi:hypothetical protein
MCAVLEPRAAVSRQAAFAGFVAGHPPQPTPVRGNLLLFPGFFGRGQSAFAAQEGVLDFQHELLAFMDLTLVDALKLKGKLAHGFVGCVEFAFQAGNVSLQLAHVVLKKERLPDKLKELLEHGG